MTSAQLQLIHLAIRQIHLPDVSYRLLLRNIAGVSSAKDLTNTTFEEIMATLEDMGFQHQGQPSHYWRATVSTRKATAGRRQVYEIRNLHAQCPRYDLGGMALRISGGRTRQVERLTSREAYSLIEALKVMAVRPPPPAAGDVPCRRRRGYFPRPRPL